MWLFSLIPLHPPIPLRLSAYSSLGGNRAQGTWAVADVCLFAVRDAYSDVLNPASHPSAAMYIVSIPRRRQGAYLGNGMGQERYPRSFAVGERGGGAADPPRKRSGEQAYGLHACIPSRSNCRIDMGLCLDVWGTIMLEWRCCLDMCSGIGKQRELALVHTHQGWWS